MQDLRCYPFEALPLPYAYNAFEPFISCDTLTIHHDTLYTNYINRLNNILKAYPKLQKLTLRQLILQSKFMSRELATLIRNNAGGVYNHEIYFNSISPCEEPINETAEGLINKCFCSIETFKQLFKECAMSHFGSGYAFLVCDNANVLRLVSTTNQDTPNLNACRPIIAIDLWEHSYFLDFQSRRSDYIDWFIRFINWNIIK